MTAMTPIDTAPLFAPLYAELIALLRALDDSDWRRPTLAPAWRVRDIVGHLLDVDLRMLAWRDGQSPAAPGGEVSFAAVLKIITDANAAGVTYSRRLSPRLMTDLLEVTGAWVSSYVASLPLHETAVASVLWAGEDRSENWMHVGRDYTERWHHQMQIREAVGAAPLLERRWLHPLLDLSVRAFRRTYMSVEAPAGTAVVFEVDGEPDYVWSIVRDDEGWRVFSGRSPSPAAAARMDADTAWRLLFNALPKEAARARVSLSGERRLVEPILGARSVMV